MLYGVQIGWEVVVSCAVKELENWMNQQRHFCIAFPFNIRLHFCDAGKISSPHYFEYFDPHTCHTLLIILPSAIK